MHLFSNRSQIMSKCVIRTKKLGSQSEATCVTDVLITFSHLLKSATEQMHTRINLFVLYDKKQNVVNGATSSMCLSSNVSLVRNLSKCIRNSAYNIIPTYRIHSKSPHHKQIFFIWLQSYTFCSISGGRHIHYLQNRINLYGKQVFLYLW